MNTYERIKEIATEHGMSIREVALKAGVGENLICRWKHTKPSLKSIQKVANALNVEVEDITSTSDKDESSQYRAIQRKAKKLSIADQEKLIDIMDTIFDKTDDE